MPQTTNFEWTLPTPGGDAGTWDTILNAAFDEIDADLKIVSDVADAAATAADAAQASADEALLAAGSGFQTAIHGSGPITVDLDAGRFVTLTNVAGDTEITFANVPEGVVRVTLILVHSGAVNPVITFAGGTFRGARVTSYTAVATPGTRYDLVTADEGATWWFVAMDT